MKAVVHDTLLDWRTREGPKPFVAPPDGR